MSKAILVVSFGTSYLDALTNSIEKIENKISEEFTLWLLQVIMLKMI